MDSVNWISANDACTCEDTVLLSQPITNMVSSVMGGNSEVQTLPTFTTEYENFGKGSCGAVEFTVAYANGTDVSLFLTIVGNDIKLASDNLDLAGDHDVTLTAKLTDWPLITTSSNFRATLLKVSTVANWPTYYE